MKKFITLVSIILIMLAQNLIAQNYCTPTYNGNGQASRWFCHILGVNFGSINRTFNAPFSYNYPNTVYEDFTNYSSSLYRTDVVPTQTYPISIYVGNGANTQYVTAWIDFNGNKTFESSERIVSEIDFENTGDHIVRANVTIPANATIGQTRLRVATNILLSAQQGPPDPCLNNETATVTAGTTQYQISSQHFQDYTVNILKPGIQTFSSANTIQVDYNDEVTKGSLNNQILRIDVRTNNDGVLSPLIVDSMFFSTLGTTNPSEIKSAKLYYTGNNIEFSDTHLVASVNSPTTYFAFQVSKQLYAGTTYFWLTYDVDPNAILGNELDARCNGVLVNIRRIPNTIDPYGARKIGYCVARGNKSNFVYNDRVTLRSINKIGYPYYNLTTGYTDYTASYSTELYKGPFHTLSVETGNVVTPNYTRAWIDFNRDGFFDPVNEIVFYDSLFKSGTQQTTGPVVDSFQVPINAVVGPTRMRLISHYDANRNAPPNTPYLFPADPCDNPVEIGEIEDFTVIIADSGQTVADFESSIACLGSPVQFTDQSSIFGTQYDIVDWLWEFGDGDTSHSQNPQHTYLAPGIYNVSLTVFSNYSAGVPNKITKAVKINDPKANFSITSNLYREPISFVDETEGGIPTKWYWDFGDPQSGFNNYSNSKQPRHTFDTVGYYHIRFIVTVEGNCIDTIDKTIFIDSVLTPIANFSAETFNPYYQQPIQYLDISDYEPTSWEWKITPSAYTFHNSTTRFDEKPVISLDQLGTYVIKLVVRNSAGADSVSKIISTKDYIKPIADFSADMTTVKAGQLISFLDESENDPIQWKWSFGNGDSAFIQHPKIAYDNIGNYTIALTAINPKGQDTRVKSNFIKVTNEYTMCDNDATHSNLFTGHIYDSGGKGENYKNGSNCGFLIKPECAGPITLVFTAFDFAPGDNIKVYDAEFPDPDKLLTPVNGISGNTVPSAIVARSGAMYIEENTTATDDQEGFAASWFALANIKPNPTIKADTIGYANGPITFYNKTSLGAGNIYFWDYNNDGIYDDTFDIGSQNTDGRTIFDSLGYYTIKLKAQNCKGIDSTSFLIHIVEPTQPPIADFTSSEDTVNEAETVQLTDLSTMGPSKWKWTIIPPDYLSVAVFVDGTTDESQHPRVQFYGIGAYTIQLYTENKIGWDSIVKQKFIYVREKAQMCIPTLNGTFTTTSSAGRLLDSGGESNYLNNSGPVSCPGIRISPCAEKVYLEFKMFDFAAGDYLRIYDGKDNTGRALHPGDGFTATELPPPLLTAESGNVFIEEITNSSINAPGFVIDWSTKPLSKPTASFNYPDTAYTNGHVAFFENTSAGVAEKFYWDYDFDGIPDDSTFHGEHAFAFPSAMQNIQLRAVSCAGESRENHSIVVAAPTTKPEADFYASKLKADTSDIIQLFENSKYGPNKWTWIFNPGKEIYVNPNDTVKARPEIKFDSSGIYDVTLIVENAFGTDTMVKNAYLQIFAYCRPIVQNSLPDFGISRVTINNLDHLTVAQAAYNDYTETHSVTLELGGTYDFTIKSSAAPNPYNRKIWIDLNQDGSFNDTTERLAFITNDNTIEWEGQINIPATALIGETRMRIGVDVAGFPNLPCGPNSFGEFEDYRVYITEDLTPPVITLKGNRTTLTEVDYPYIDSGAVAYDAVDGDITNKITVTSNVDTSTIGQYWVKYNVEDSKGNKAEEVVRNVFVTPDRTPPVITLLGDDPVSIQVYYPYTEYGATATDNKDGDVTSKIQIEHVIDTARVDTYKVLYSAYDNNANFTSIERTVYVSDSIAPVISLIGPDTLSIPIAGIVNDPGVDVTDNYYHDLTATVNTNVDEGIEGWYWIRYNATDPSNNSAREVERTVKVGNPVSTPDQIVKENNIAVYPNPTTGLFTISVALNKTARLQISIVNVLGEEIIRKDYRNVNDQDIAFDLSGNAEGVYLVKLLIGHELEVFRVTYVK